ncbi:PssD/Cps14F family polysaccharide biosynthesis glycosyltransferase [Butyrivibrio sp. NC3005]|uniref:PssD/Cps14F family polysaccharide biosynthesis glycosyltransferase n=1 Tax=Butyrivibrio sp. NC3005 TaxID=1280685 RepID=UPI0004291EA8|nr:PssD/Cps14F family polysaccharide biosynthesis glycosyltransferase [Butyrivibrio sp. NC3005]
MGYKVCFAASAGGHLEEVSCLKELAEKYDSFLFTEEVEFSENKICERTITVPVINRHEKGFFFNFIKLTLKSNDVLKKERPDFIISTGALATVPICILGKLKRVKVIYIESFARVDELSLTGKIMKHVADLFIYQWEDLKDKVPNGVFGGGIF